MIFGRAHPKECRPKDLRSGARLLIPAPSGVRRRAKPSPCKLFLTNPLYICILRLTPAAKPPGSTPTFASAAAGRRGGQGRHHITLEEAAASEARR
jgi:hypothetical protein